MPGRGFLKRKRLAKEAAYFRAAALRRRYFVLVGAAFGAFMALAILAAILML